MLNEPQGSVMNWNMFHAMDKTNAFHGKNYNIMVGVLVPLRFALRKIIRGSDF